MKDIKAESSWYDRVSYSNVFVFQLERIFQAKMFKEFGNYRRGIDTIIISLYKPLREEVQKYIDTLPEMDEEELYDMVLERIIDELTEKGYLKHEKTDVATGGE